ncbi:uncharacterized protein LOC127585951 [Pristis pectinata]|uniref:uncharacterized protein LOC127585951 n=1 Tax=Pristis pectinata TaxID=685728 RepID=UPI00223D944A|nr:uncharacterized protein LOC127585951 [Pristis pectinata]
MWEMFKDQVIRAQDRHTQNLQKMFKEALGVCCICLFTYLFAVNAAATLRVARDRLTGTVGQSVLLPASYTDSDSHGYLRITWTKAGSRIADFRCPSDRSGNFDGCHQTIPIPDHYKHRAVFFLENASLLLRDLQISDSGVYELSIGHSTGMEKGSLNLTVQPSTRDTPGTTNRTDMGHKIGSHSRLEFILPPVGIAVIAIFLLLTVKMRRGCKQAQEQTEKRNTAEDHQKSQERAGALYAELQWPQHTKEKRKIHFPKETVEGATVQNTDFINDNSAVLRAEMPSGTNEEKMHVSGMKTKNVRNKKLRK